MPDPNGFLFSWLKDGEELWLSGSWLEVQLERLYRSAEHWRVRSKPILYVVSGPGIRVRGRMALQACCVPVGTN